MDSSILVDFEEYFILTEYTYSIFRENIRAICKTNITDLFYKMNIITCIKECIKDNIRRLKSINNKRLYIIYINKYKFFVHYCFLLDIYYIYMSFYSNIRKETLYVKVCMYSEESNYLKWHLTHYDGSNYNQKNIYVNITKGDLYKNMNIDKIIYYGHSALTFILSFKDGNGYPFVRELFNKIHEDYYIC